MYLDIELFQGMIINTSILLLITHILTKITYVRRFIYAKHETLKAKLILISLFGMVAIISTYSGVQVNGAIVNIRIVSVLGSGLLFGPFVGLGTGIIAGIHRYYVNTADFTNLACAISTVLEGILGGYFYLKLRRNDQHNYISVLLLGIGAGILQMTMILIIAQPFEQALALVKLIALPMVTLNALGLVLFVSMVDSVFYWQERQSAEKIKLVLTVAQNCLPHLRKGLYNEEELYKAANIICDKSSAQHVVICDLERILVSVGEIANIDTQSHLIALECAKKQLEEDATQKVVNRTEENQYQRMIAPLTNNDALVGFIMFLVPINYSRNELMVEFIDGLAKLMSTQLELAQIEIQNEAIKQAEFDALQSQINPHFIFNVLTTIISISRYDADKARELLVSMSAYFRFVLKSGNDLITLGDEMQHVHAYLALEKARFEDWLNVELCYDADDSCLVPRFIIQPIVENAIKHGLHKNQDKRGIIRIHVKQTNDEIDISIEDNGQGIDDHIIEQLYTSNMNKDKVGLSNVHQRLIHFYGQGLVITKPSRGTHISMKIYKGSKNYDKYSNSR